MKPMLHSKWDSRQTDEIHKVVYIVYHDGTPHEVVTLLWFEDEKQYRCPHQWDFEKDGLEDNGSLIFFKSGFGGQNEIGAPTYASDAKGVTYWMDTDSIQFTDGKQPANCVRIDAPLRLKSPYSKSRNPFRHGEEQYSIDYCHACDAYYGDGGCPEHEYCEEHCCYACTEQDHEDDATDGGQDNG